MTAALPIIALGLTAVGTAASVVGSISQGQADAGAIGAQAQAEVAQQASAYNAEIARRNAEIQRYQSEAEAHRYNAELQRQDAARALREAAAEETIVRREALRIRSAQQASFGAAGVTLEGSPLELLEEAAVAAELDALSARYAGTTQAERAHAQARLDAWLGQGAEWNRALQQQNVQVLGQNAARQAAFTTRSGQLQAQAARRSGYFTAGARLLGGGADVFDQASKIWS